MHKVLWQTPDVPATLLKSPILEPLVRRQCCLKMIYENAVGKNEIISLIFIGVEAFKCTYMTSVSVQWVEQAYCKLVEVPNSLWLVEIQKLFSGPPGTISSLRHLGIYYDDGPLYEFICKEFSVEHQSLG